MVEERGGGVVLPSVLTRANRSSLPVVIPLPECLGTREQGAMELATGF